MLDQMKLGCSPTPPTLLAKVPYLADHLTLPLAADSCDYVRAMREPWGMLANDQYGDCVFAAFAHFLQGASVNATGVPRKFTDEQVLGWYHDVTGFDPNDPSTDNGTVPIQALNYLLSIGEIEFFGRVDVTRPAHVAAAIELFGGLYSAWALPKAWQKSTNFGKLGPNTIGDWAPGSWGGHMMSNHGYDASLNLPTVTWGALRNVTPEALATYCYEAYAIGTKAWVNSHGATIQGFDLDGLKSRLGLLT